VSAVSAETCRFFYQKLSALQMPALDLRIISATN
jgi:hypothetical protein